MKFARLSELACTMFHKILTDWFIWADRKHWLRGVQWCLHASTALHVCWMVILAGGSIFTTPRP